jgi:glucose-1-phosphate adenylyltransferase
VAAIPVPIEQGPQFGVIEADATGKIVHFHEKSATPPAMIGDPTRCLASMGNYVFTTKALIDVVTPREGVFEPTDIGRDVIPELTSAGRARVYDFSTNEIPGQVPLERGYWRDVGTLDAYYDANMDLIAPVPLFDLYNDQWPMYSLQLPLPPAKLSNGFDGSQPGVTNSLLCAGSIVSGGQIDRSIIGPDVYVDAGAVITESILFPGVRVAAGVRLHRAILDKNVRVPVGGTIGIDAAADSARFTMSTNGVVVVPKDTNLYSEQS